MEIVISQRGVYDNFMLLPKGGFRVPNLPVLLIVPGIDNVATNGYEGWLLFVNGLHQSLPDKCIRCLGVRGIVKSCIAKCDESKLTGHIQHKRLVIRSKKRLIGGTRPAGRQRRSG